MAIGSPQWMYASGEAHELEQSLKFDSGGTSYLSFTPSSAGNRKTWTWSGWVKRASLGTIQVLESVNAGSGNSNIFHIYLDSDDDIKISLASFTIQTVAKYRDASSWYHIMVVVDTTQATDTNRFKIYVNGTQQTLTTSNTYPSQNDDLAFNQTSEHNIGRRDGDADRYTSSYLAELNFVDGQALTPADFGETGTYGEWKPIEYSGTYGTNGFYLPFKQDYTVEGFSTVTWKNTAPMYVGGVGFKSDLIWTKSRASQGHAISDSITGFDRYGQTNSTNDFYTPAEIGGNLNPTADGFTTNTGWHSNGHSYVGWNWDMGANSPTGFGCVTYTGSGADQSISGFGFSPDLVWAKKRGATGHHFLFDTVRGTNKQLKSSNTGAETTHANYLEAFEPDGFRLGSDSDTNASGTTHVSWGWDMGNTTATNTSGSISSTVMANPTYGQSIVSYVGNQTSGATVGHGLSSAPEMVIVKNRSQSSPWAVYHHSLADTQYLRLNETSSAITSSTRFNSTDPSSTVFTLGNDSSVNGDTASDDLVAYCFHSVSGYSKFGSYTGNGSATGPSVTLGFRPAFLMVKISTDSGGWEIWDSTRNPLNPVTKSVQANLSNAELTSGRDIEFTDTGFQIKNTTSNSNGSGETYIYMAFAGGMDSISDYNTTGTSDSRVKANTTYGQSIVTYKGQSGAQTVGHGLSSTPEMIIAKNRSSAQEWLVYHHSLTDAKDKYLRLDTTSAVGDNTFWNDTAPTSSVFSVGDSQPINSGHGNDYVAYCFHSVTGYSKFGSYSGTGNASGNSVTLGFEPAFVMVKASSGSYSWAMFDNTRAPDSALFANLSNAEESLDYMDFTSTGFNLTTTHPNANASGQTYIYMAFADKREYAYWLDQSGNNNDWTSNNLTESDISVDSPTNNFCTINPLTRLGVTGSNTQGFAEGNLMMDESSNGWSCYGGTHLMPSGKYYWEMHMAGSGSVDVNMGMVVNDFNRGSNAGIDTTGAYSIYTASNGVASKYDNSASSSTVSDGAFTWGDIVQVAYDADSGKMFMGKNNTYFGSGNPATGANPFLTVNATNKGKLIPAFSQYHSSSEIIANFGQDSSFAGNKTAQGNQDSNDIGDFYYTPPTGFLALCTKNLPDVAVTPSEHFNTTLFTGDGTSNRDITGTGFNPDLNWLKMRSGADNHVVTDVMRGTNHLHTNTTDADSDLSYPALVTDGFRVSGGTYNNNSSTFVAWQWKANGTGSSNTDGDITSTVSANVDAGFSIVGYTGNGSSLATIGHGLSKAPELIHIKNRTDSDSWISFTTVIDSSLDYMYLNLTNAKEDLAIATPTSSVFSVDSGNQINGSGDAHIAYCFHSVDGYSKVGSYTGNASTDGTFVYTGFRPMLIITKSTQRAEHWRMRDTVRDTDNPLNTHLEASASGAEQVNNGVDIDILSNGFKLRSSDSGVNANGEKWIYIAFAETPFKYSNAR